MMILTGYMMNSYFSIIRYDEKDFIIYLNKWIFPNMTSIFIETLEWIDSKKDIPERYKGCEWFNF